MVYVSVLIVKEKWQSAVGAGLVPALCESCFQKKDCFLDGCILQYTLS